MSSSSLPKGGSFDGAPVSEGVTVEKDTNLTVKNQVPIFEELITEPDHVIQTYSNFSRTKMTQTDCVTDNCKISSDLIEVAVMDEDTVNLNRDLRGKQSEQISPPVFEGSYIVFKVGYGNVQGNKNKSKGQHKRSGNHEKGERQSMYGPKKVEAEEESTTGNPTTKKNWKRLAKAQFISNSSTTDVDSGHKRKQVENCNTDALGVKREKKHRSVENEQGVMSNSGSREAAGQPG
ncbi:hypothetical protein CMV_030130 [Castanea mollissima]|uniref:Uncharacterized protein n=1 Tax=Castanea mollissima TaxID=60419 RepID=A0A8J4QD39_9ROSI|nr:hypothetical protein CMV_030130 [Castanea mollissima]